MGTDTKTKILSCAERLFREKGYNGVSMRDIAEEVGIKVGNLTYYFPKKEVLIETLLLSEKAQMPMPESIHSPQELMALLQHILTVHRQFAFYFDSYVQLSQTSEVLRQAQYKRIESLRPILRDGLQNLVSQGHIPPPGYREELDDRVEVLLNLLMLRLPGTERQNQSPDQEACVLRRLKMVIGLP